MTQMRRMYFYEYMFVSFYSIIVAYYCFYFHNIRLDKVIK